MPGRAEGQSKLAPNGIVRPAILTGRCWYSLLMLNVVEHITTVNEHQFDRYCHRRLHFLLNVLNFCLSYNFKPCVLYMCQS